MNRKDILDRLQTDVFTATTSGANAWDSDIPEHKTRYIVALLLIGDGVASRTVDIEKVEEDDSTTSKFPAVPVPPADVVQIPPSGYDVRNPILVLEGGTNLKGTVNAGDGVKVVVIYWDDPAV